MENEHSKLRLGTEKSILALQHLIAMFGATVLVPMITGFNPSIALFTAGVGTLIFHVCTKGKVPVFLGSSFAFIPVILTVKEMYGGDLAYAQGGIMIAGLIYVLLSILMRFVSMDKIRKLLAPQVIGPMIIVIGLGLIPTALDMASQNFMVAFITLGIALLIKFKGSKFTSQLCILIAVVIGYFISLGMNMVDTQVITQATLFSVPSFTLPKFELGAILIITPVVLAVFMEHLGDITTSGQVVGKDFIKNPSLSRTLLGDGLATMFASLVGGPANTTYGENTGVLAITKNYDPSILRLTALFAILLAFVSKIGILLTTIPNAVMGGISLMLFTMIALIGVKTLKNEKVKFNFKNTLVIGTILILGLGGEYISNLSGITIGIPISETVQITGLSFSALIGITLNFILDIFIKES